MRGLALVALIAGLAFLVGCSNSSGSTPVGVPITVTVSASATSLNPGQQSTLTATVANTSNTGVTWSISPAGFGSLSPSTTANPVTYTAPTSVPTATTVTITATSAASSGSAGSVQIAVATSAIGISLSPVAPQTLDQGKSLSITATLTNDTSGKGVAWSISPSNVGSLANPTSTAVTYQAPTSVTSNTKVTVKATSNADSKATAFVEITVFPSGAGPNVAAISVDGGPVGVVDSAYTSVTICAPSSSPPNCQTVDGILVDTGSVGLRVLASQIPGLALPVLTDNSGDTVNDCVQFVDGTFAWGQVETADVEIGGETASGISVQVIATPSFAIPSTCSGTNADTPQALGANGILGIGPEPTDCFSPGVGSQCDSSTGLTATPPTPFYYLCNGSGCTASGLGPTFVPFNQQVFNPVAAFTTDNNGTLIQFPTPSANAVSTLNGSLIFGIGTAGNNALGTATVLTMDSFDNMGSIFQGQNLISSFIDSGSNGLFFPANLPTCAVNTSFFCPTSTTNLSAINQSNVVSGQTKTTNFTIDNADNLFNNSPPTDFVFSTLGGPNGTFNSCNSSTGAGACTFDWGLPAFFPPIAPNGVFTGIDNVNLGIAPFWAY